MSIFSLYFYAKILICMNNFNYQDELKKMVVNKQLVDIHFRGDDEGLIAYLFFLNEEYFMFGEVSKDATFAGTSICLTRELECIQTETRFIKELHKQIKNNELHEQAWDCIKEVKKISFKDFLSTFQGSKTLLSIKTVDGVVLTGRVFANDNEVVVLDEYYLEEDMRFSRTYINLSLINSITVGGTWLKINSESLKEKNL